MNNLSAILNAYHREAECEVECEVELDRTTFLATVVQTKGSTYRKAGARMLIADRGEIVGMVSGGCLEQDILCHVQQQTPPYQPFVITYDITTDEDILWGFGLGCDGVVRVLVESIGSTHRHNPLTFIAACFDRQQPGILATVFQIEGCVSVPIGARLMLPLDGRTTHNIEDVELAQAIAADAQTALNQQKTLHRQYCLSLGSFEVLIELIQPPPHLVIFGAGRDALPLAQFAKALGWQLTIVDCRSLATTGDRFPMADQITLSRRDIISQQVPIVANTIAVVMTHNYLDDFAILQWLCASPAQYIGILGSRQRTERLLQELQPKVDINANAQCHRLHAPVGLDIGAETPEEIAIAIIAEIQAVITDRPAGFLKHRQVAIHRAEAVLSSPHCSHAIQSQQ
jgi:xanthine dehydrogenase accessory factor